MNLGTFKGKKVAAQKGFDLLKSKADALKVTISQNNQQLLAPYAVFSTSLGKI